MSFHVGPIHYAVRIAPGIVAVDGIETDGAWIESAREILIAATCPVQRRLGMLMFGLMQAWTAHTGDPATKFGWCDLAATALESALRDLSTCGGNEALMRLNPGEVLSGSSPIAITKNRQCAKCRMTIAGGSVKCKALNIPNTVELSLFCDHCQHTQTWRELTTITGLPSGVIVSEPMFIDESMISES